MADGEEHAWWKPYYRQIEPALTFTVPRKVKIVDARLVSIPADMSSKHRQPFPTGPSTSEVILRRIRHDCVRRPGTMLVSSLSCSSPCTT